MLIERPRLREESSPPLSRIEFLIICRDHGGVKLPLVSGVGSIDHSSDLKVVKCFNSGLPARYLLAQIPDVG